MADDDPLFVADLPEEYIGEEDKTMSLTNIPSPTKIYNELSKFVIGQDDAKKSLAIVAYNHLMRLKRNASSSYLALPPRLTLMVMGSSGTGKTLLCRTLCNYLSLPFYHIDASSMTSPGNHGGASIKDHLKNYVYENRGSSDVYNYGIIYIDEFDKIFKFDANGSGDNSSYYNSLVSSLLTVIDGTSNDVDYLDTSKLLFIFSGAFEYVSRIKETKAQPIGFKTEHTSKHTMLTREEIEESSGIPPEMLSRLNVITQTYKLSKEEIKDVITNCADAILPQFESTFLLSGEKLKLTDNELDAIVDKAYNSKYGMRYCKSILFEHLKDKMFNLKG